MVILIALGETLTILNIGKDRKPITPGVAAVSVLIGASWIIGIFHYWK